MFKKTAAEAAKDNRITFADQRAHNGIKIELVEMDVGWPRRIKAGQPFFKFRDLDETTLGLSITDWQNDKKALA